MSALAGILAGFAAAAFLGGIVVAWADAIACMRAEHGRSPSPSGVLGGAAIFLIGLGGAAVGTWALATALEVAR